MDRPSDDSDAVTVLGQYQRARAPEGVPEPTSVVAVVIPESLETVWADWGPLRRPAIAPPEVDQDLGQVVVIWFAGQGLDVTGYRVGDDGLIVEGVHQIPDEGCVDTADIGGVTVVLAIDDDRVQPDLAIGPAEIAVERVSC